MAYFKLSLLDFAEDSTSKNASFLSSTMSEFYSQEEAHQKNKISFCYTYNETLNLHTNAQKDLSFSIDRMILKDNEWIENPFSRYMTIGTQLALEDGYHNQYFFIIKEVKYTFKPQNMVAAVTCQDAFTYQMSRQNDGYEITNDSSDDDFIGAKDIDWWTTKKIIPECFVSYNYLKLNQGLYMDSEGTVHIFNNSVSSIENTSGIKIIKQPYDKANYKDYYETFAFSGSGTADSILISLGEQIGLMLQTFEHFNSDNSFDKYFWFEPQQHEQNNGLYYSPFSSIQSFSLSHSGSSLATILNVSGSSSDNEVVSLLPEVTPFISQSFTSAEWLTSKWHKNFFHEWIKERIIHYSSKEHSTNFRIWHKNSDKIEEIKASYKINNESPDSITNRSPFFKTIENNDTQTRTGTEIYLPVSTDDSDQFLVSSLYDHYSFLTDNHDSEIVLKNSSNTLISLAPLNSSFSLVVAHEGERELVEFDDNLFNHIGTQGNCVWLRISTSRTDIDEGTTIDSEDIYFRWYREPTSSDIAFADVADEIPWLENKLIDFSYFQHNSVLSPEEVKNLTKLIYNDLRIANGKLIFYSKQYYSALHAKTKIISDMENQFDVLGANFYSDVVSPYATDKIVSNIDNFTNAYNNIYFSLDVKQPEGLLNYNDTYSSYVNKYINAQQSFLKNIYNFISYFNYPLNLNSDMCLYEDTISLQNNEPNVNDLIEQIVTFNDGGKSSYETITASTDSYDSLKASKYYGKPKNTIYAFYKNSSSVVKPLIAYKNCPEWNDLVYEDPSADIDQGMQKLTNAKYDNKQSYYQKVLILKIDKKLDENEIKSVTVTNKDNQITKSGYKIIKDDDGKYTLQVYPLEIPEFIDPETIMVVYGNDEVIGYGDFTIGFRKISDKEIKALWFFRKGRWKINNYCVRISNKYNYQPIKNIFKHLNNNIYQIFDPNLYKDSDSSKPTEETFCYNYYKNIPLSSFYFRDHYWKTTISDDKKSETYQIISATGGTLASFLNGENEDNPWDDYKFYEVPILNSNNIGKYYVLNASAIAEKNISKSFYDWCFQSISNQKYNQSQFYDNWSNNDVKNPAPVACSDKYAWRKIKYNKNLFDDNSVPTSQIDVSNNEAALSNINLGLYTNSKNNSGKTLTLKGKTKDITLYLNDKVCYPAFANKFILSWGVLYHQIKNKKTNGWASSPTLNMLNTDACYYKDKWLQIVDSGDIHKGNTYYLIPLYYTKDKKYENLEFTNILSSKDALVKDMCLPLENIYADGREFVNTNKKYLSSIVDWPFEQNKVKMDIVWDSNGNISSVTAGDFQVLNVSDLSKIQYLPEEWSSDNPPNVTAKCIICKAQDYVEVKPTEDEILNGTCIYNADDDLIVNPLEFSDCIDGLYVKRVFKEIEKLPSAKNSEFNLTYLYYDQDGNRYYTVPQLFEENNSSSVKYRWNTSTTYVYKSLSKDTLNLTLQLKTTTKRYNKVKLKHHIHVDKNSTLTWVVIGKQLDVSFYLTNTDIKAKETIPAELIAYSTEGVVTIRLNKQPTVKTATYYRIKADASDIDTGNYTVDTFFTNEEDKVFISESSKIFQQDFTTSAGKIGAGDNFISPNQDNGLIEKVPYTWVGRTLDDLQNIHTMGNFWYKFHKDLDQPVLFNFAASIEAQLEEYWQSAYTASNYCEYFIPEHWQPTESGNINYFSDHILSINKKDNTVTISSLFVPVVERYRNDELTNSGEEYLLPQYVLKYNPTTSLSSPEDGEVFASKVFMHNDAMQNIKNVIGIDYRDFTAIKTSAKITYYYSNSGGMKHADLIKFLGIKANQDFNNYSGLYIMELKWLQDHYSNYPLDGYDMARKEHDSVWQNIYSKYPAMMLENKYSNTDATDSKQLLMLAKNYFKDLSNPERNYSITLIDNLNNCVGYKGQELKVGDSIRLRASEFYDSFDDISSSLNQLLFITDIKYTLRKDTDISLTVNAIKYQNKLIKRLAKLIQ